MSESDTTRAWFHDASTGFVTTVAEVDPREWERESLGVWTLRSLVGHTSRALSTVERAIDGAVPGTPIDLDSAAAYLHAAESADDDEIAERGRRSGDDLGEDPATAVRVLATRVGALVDHADDDLAVPTPFGTIRLVDYLATRAFELTVHGLDVATAGGVRVPELTAGSIRHALRLAVDRAAERDEDALVLRALTGRAPLPPGFSVL